MWWIFEGTPLVVDVLNSNMVAYEYKEIVGSNLFELLAEVHVNCWRCILVHQTCSLHFGLDFIMELTRH
jgi:hypothetical protein